MPALLSASNALNRQLVACPGAHYPYYSTWLLLLLQFLRCGNYKEFSNYGIGPCRKPLYIDWRAITNIHKPCTNRTKYETRTDCTGCGALL